MPQFFAQVGSHDGASAQILTKTQAQPAAAPRRGHLPRAVSPRPRVSRMPHAAAEKAELTGQVRSFLAWIGDGRKLTQTGRIGLADARRLVESRGTGDTFDPKIGRTTEPGARRDPRMGRRLRPRPV
jgi:hypothetical protein